MPHINHQRGETRTFVFRREGRLTCDRKKQRSSFRVTKDIEKGLFRAREKAAVIHGAEPPVLLRSVRWNFF